MDPLTLILGSLAVVFGLTTMMYWRRAADLEERVRELEAKLTDTLPAPKDVAKDEPAAREEPLEERAPAATEQEDDEEEEDEDEDEEEEGEDEEEADEEPEAEAPAEEEDDDEEDDDDDEEVAAAPPEPEPAKAEPEPAKAEPAKPEPEPAKAEPAKPVEPAKPAAPPEPDPLRLEALKIVTEAFELARYLDFDAIVEKPSTYRVTVPITAANGKALRYMSDGMFTCLKKVKVEGSAAVLHVDTSKGPP